MNDSHEMEERMYKYGTNCYIENTAQIGENCKIGDNVIIHHNVVIYDGTEIGDGTEIFDGAVIGRNPKGSGNLIHKLEDNYPPVIIGKNCVIGANAVIYADNIFEDNVLLGDCAQLREGCRLKKHSLVAKLCTLNHHVVVGENSKVMDNTHITARTIIEDNVFIGVGIASANDNNMRIKGSEVSKESVITFKKGCKIGSGSIILPGITIGENAVVGAGSVVTKSVNDDSTVMGVPAKERRVK